MAERDRDERAILEAFESFERELAAPDVSGAVRAELGIRPRGRRAAAVLAAVIAAALLITGCAAAFGGLEWLSSRLGAGGFTDVLEPQEAAAEREGIEMTVLGAQGFGDSAAAYISLRDTAGLGRVREEPGCQAVFAINGTGRTEQVYFDEETGTGYYVVLAYDENGGLSGPAVKPVALRMVWQVANAVKIPVLGLGGIASWQDAVEFMLAGASAVAVGAYNFVNPCAVEEIAEGMDAYCEKMGISHISEIIGKIND